MVDGCRFDGLSCLVEAGQRHVAFLLDPIIVLLSEYCSDQSDDGFPIGENPYHVTAAPDFTVQPLCRVIRLDLGPH